MERKRFFTSWQTGSREKKQEVTKAVYRPQGHALSGILPSARPHLLLFSHPPN
jgi:hypothetical protein